MRTGHISNEDQEEIDRYKKRTWNYATLDELHVHVNSILRQAMLNERYKRWKKVLFIFSVT